MPVTVQERYGRRVSDQSAELLYLVRGTADAGAARTALLTDAPATYESLPRDDAEVEEVIPKVSIDYCFFSKNDEKVSDNPMLVMLDEEKGDVFARGTRHKWSA